MNYCAIDISEGALRDAATRLLQDYDSLKICAIRADFSRSLPVIPPGDGRLVAILGGSAGNFTDAQRLEFFISLAQELKAGDSLLFTSDLVKSPTVLIPAYNDSRGVTAEFNINMLAVLNRELGANFEIPNFDHRAAWDSRNEWIEMGLVARCSMSVELSKLGRSIFLTESEEIRTEISNKLRPEQIKMDLNTAGFRLSNWWTDERGYYSMSLWTPKFTP